MCWETRARGGQYSRRSVRTGGQQQEAERHQAQQARAAVNALNQQIREATEAAELLFRGTMLLAGYHRHERGEWRIRRGT
ncbi:MAG TPA: hypothetical protein VK689_23680 [Armatimonadota bacterium]|nr:hypothetical protein [Armatimonadota bacterium]